MVEECSTISGRKLVLSSTEPKSVSKARNKNVTSGIAVARVISRYFSNRTKIFFCTCSPATFDCGTNRCSNAKQFSSQDVECCLLQNASDFSKFSDSKIPAQNPSPIIGIRSPEWSFGALLEAGDLAEAATLAASLSDWRNFFLLSCASYLLRKTSSPRNFCQRRLEHKLKKVIKAVLTNLLDHCLRFDQQQHRFLSSAPPASGASSSTAAGVGDLDDEVTHHDVVDSVVSWDPVEPQARVEQLVHSRRGHRFVTTVSAVFGVDAVTTGFRWLYQEMESVVQRLEFLVPRGLHLPLPPHFALGTHFNMVVVGTDPSAVKEVVCRKRISWLCHQMLTHLDESNCLVACLLPLVELSAQIKSEDGSQRADVSAILETGSKIGLPNFSQSSRSSGDSSSHFSTMSETVETEETMKGLTELTDCFDALMTMLWLLATRDRLSAAWRNYKVWKALCVSNAFNRNEHLQKVPDFESDHSATSEVLEASAQFLRALDLTSLNDSNPALKTWWETDARALFNLALNDWLSCNPTLTLTLLASCPSVSRLLTRKSRPEWLPEHVIVNPAESPLKNGCNNRRSPNPDYLRFLSLFVEMAMSDVRRLGDADAAFDFVTPPRADCVKRWSPLPALPCFGTDLRRRIQSSIRCPKLLLDSGCKSWRDVGISSGKLRFILWLHRWARDSAPFCKCLVPFQTSTMMTDSIRIKLDLPQNLLVKALVSHVKSFRTKSCRDKPAVDEMLSEPKTKLSLANEISNKNPSVPVAILKREPKSLEPLQQEQILSPENPLLIEISQSSRREESRKTHRRKPEEFSSCDESQKFEFLRKHALQKILDSTPTKKTSFSNLDQEKELRLEMEVPNKNDEGSQSNGGTEIEQDSAQNSPGIENKIVGQESNPKLNGLAAEKGSSAISSSSVETVLERNGEKNAVLKAGRSDSVVNYEPKSESGLVCRDASSLQEFSEAAGSDPDDTLNDFTLPSSSPEMKADEFDQNGNQPVIVSSGKSVSNDVQNAKSGTSLSKMIKRIFQRTQNQSKDLRAENNNNIQETCKQPESNRVTFAVQTPQPLRLLQVIQDSSESRSYQHFERRRKRSKVKKGQDFLVHHILKKMESGLRIVQEFRKSSSSLSSKPLQVPKILKIPLTSSSADEDTFRNDEKEPALIEKAMPERIYRTLMTRDQSTITVSHVGLQTVSQINEAVQVEFPSQINASNQVETLNGETETVSQKTPDPAESARHKKHKLAQAKAVLALALLRRRRANRKSNTVQIPANNCDTKLAQTESTQTIPQVTPEENNSFQSPETTLQTQMQSPEAIRKRVTFAEFSQKTSGGQQMNACEIGNSSLWEAILHAENAAFRMTEELRSSHALLAAIENLTES